VTVGGGKILKELEGLLGGRALAGAPEKLGDATIIADAYCLSRITCKYFICGDLSQQDFAEADGGKRRNPKTHPHKPRMGHPPRF
jgi:hypothetical protein